MKNNPMSERRAALDLAIVALDVYRREKLVWMQNPDNKKKLIDEVNQAIKILTSMKDEGPLL